MDLPVHPVMWAGKLVKRSGGMIQPKNQIRPQKGRFLFKESDSGRQSILLLARIFQIVWIKPCFQTLTINKIREKG